MRPLLRHAVLLLAALSLSACCAGAADGSGSCTLPEPLTPPAPPDPLPEPSDAGVRFTGLAHYVTQDGKVASRTDGYWGGTPLPMVLVPGGAADGGFREYLAESTGEGQWFARNVPEGEAYVQLSGVYLHTLERQVSMDVTRFERMGISWSLPQTTAVQLRATGLAPWVQGSVLRLSALNGGDLTQDRRLYAAEGVEGYPPAPGATQLDVRLDSFVTQLDGAAGDSLWVHQLAWNDETGGNGGYLATVRGFMQPAFSVVPGATVSLEAALSEGPQREARFTLDSAAMALQTRETHPHAVASQTFYWRIGARPGPVGLPLPGIGPELASAYPLVFDTPPFHVRFTDDFPEHWQRVAEVTYLGHLNVKAPGAERGTDTLLSISRVDLLSQWAEGTPIGPRLGPVRNLRVNGQPAAAGLQGVGRTPRLSWEAPALGVAEQYTVRIWGLAESNGDTQLVPVFSRLVTTGTQVQLPPGMVPAQGGFVVVVMATRGASVRSPFTYTVPFDLAEASTGVLTP